MKTSAVIENIIMIIVAFLSIYYLDGGWKWFFIIPVLFLNYPKSVDNKP